MLDLKSIKKIYFIGIGGIGISATAGMMKAKGYEVGGSDASAGEIVEDLRRQGVTVHVPHHADNLLNGNFDAVVYSVAVPADNPEFAVAVKLNLPLLTYPQLLGLLSDASYGIGVSGTDGKTTTTAILAKMLLSANLDPTVVLGSKADFLNGNWRLGSSNYFVFEADEYRRAFDNYHPQMVIITNIGSDHLDFYGTEKKYRQAFYDYVKRIPNDGFLIINIDDEGAVSAGLKCRCKVITFSLNKQADFRAQIKGYNDGRQIFEIFENNLSVGDFSIGLPGDYNVYNALSAFASARLLGVDVEALRLALADFNGVWRRFEKLGYCQNALVVADYAHTPPAVKQAIKATYDLYNNKKILAVFQPHQYARTKNLFNEFVNAFDLSLMTLLPDIFYVEGRENPADFDVSSAKLVEAMKTKGLNAVATGDLSATEEKIKTLANDYDVILLLGAGDIYGLAKRLIK